MSTWVERRFNRKSCKKIVFENVLISEYTVKSVFSESSTFSKTIYNLLVRFPVISLSDIKVHTSGAHEISGDLRKTLKIFL